MSEPFFFNKRLTVANNMIPNIMRDERLQQTLSFFLSV